MSILKKLLTAVRGAASDAGEAIVDTQAIRIMEQEMRDAKKQLNVAKENLTKIMAEKMGVEREVKRLQKSVTEHEAYAMQALEKNDETLALQVADKIAELTNELETQTALLNSYSDNVKTLKQSITTTERNIKSLERELSVVKTTESVQKANAAAAAKFSGSGSSLSSASESLERIKSKQQKRSDQMKAAMELQQEQGDGDLQSKLKAAGIVNSESSGNDILARIKAKRAAG